MARSRILDTNLLFDSALNRFADKAPKSLGWRARSSLRVLKTQDAVDLFAAQGQHHRFVTTHLVLAEVGTLARRTLWPKEVAVERSPTWPFLEALRETIAELRLEVHTLPYREGRTDLLESFGPTDADLVAVTLVLSKAPGGAALLTADEKLATWCDGNDVACDYFDPLAPSLS